MLTNLTNLLKNESRATAIEFAALDQRGSTMVVTALASPVLFGCVGLAVDVSCWMVAQRNMQGAADMAAYSAVIAAAAGGGASPTIEAKGITAQMGFVDGQAGVTVSVNNPPSQGNHTGDANGWEVIVTQPQQRDFTTMFGVTPTVTGRAVGTAASGCHADAGGNDTGGASGTNFVLSNNETATLPDMNGKTMQVSGYGTVQFSHDANGATLVVDSSCIYVTSLAHDFNGSTFIGNYVPPNMNKVSVAHNCNGCTFTGGSLGSGGLFAIGHDANGSNFTFNTCASCSTSSSGQITYSLVE